MLGSHIVNFNQEAETINLFLEEVKFRKFYLWPNETRETRKTFLFNNLRDSQNTSKIFLVTHNEKLVTLLSIRKLEWDSNHFGFSCATIDYFLYDKRWSHDILEKSLNLALDRLRKYCIEDKIKFVSASVDSWDVYCSSALQKMNFRYIQSWIDGFFKASNQLPGMIHGQGETGNIKKSEVEYFKKISSTSYFRGGRFYLDPTFDKHLADKLYEQLVENSYKSNDIMLVYRINNEPVGLFICRNIKTYESFSNLRVAHLRYLIVDPRYRKQNVGKNLYIATIKYLQAISDLICTGLEVHNLQSLNLHAKLGFKFNYTHNAFHWMNN